MKIKTRTLALTSMIALALATLASQAQSLYDSTLLRTINLQFHDTSWLTLLPQNYASQTNILADLTMDGITYPSVGVRIRGNTSYTTLPAGSQKWSLNIDMEHVNPLQDLMGYKNLNLNNGHRDPTFCREVVYNNIVRKYIPNAKACHVLLTLNGQNWGVYINVQQYDKKLLGDWFDNNDGMRVKCANTPNGPGLVYNGTTQAGYFGYEMKDTGGLALPWAALGAACNAVTNGSMTNWLSMDDTFAVDRSSWSVVLENLLTDDDSYSNKGADFVIYRDPIDGRTHLHQTDANETFTQTTWAPTRNFTASNKPFLSHVLGVAELRQRYLSHYRVARADLDWATLNTEFTRLKTLISAAVQADPKKLYTYQNFLDNFTTTVTLPGTGPSGGTVVGLQQFVTSRVSYLNGIPDLMAVGPTIAEVGTSSEFPDPSQQVWATARVTPNGAAVTKAELYYRPSPAGRYQRVQMADNGFNHDGAAGDGVYGALLSVTATNGQLIPYYISATAANTYASLSFYPAKTEFEPLWLGYSFGMTGVRITEYMYNGLSGEFVEITNLTSAPVDLTGWSTDDADGIAGTTPLTGAGVLAPGQSIILTDAQPAAFAAAWGLTGTTVLGPNLTGEFGRNDEIHLFNASGTLVDRLRYGDENYPGTIRTTGVSGQICRESVGQDNIGGWVLAVNGDAYGSRVAATGEVGSPGTFLSYSCNGPSCPADINHDGLVDGLDLGSILSGWGGPGAGDLDGSGVIDGIDLGALLSGWGACQ